MKKRFLKTQMVMLTMICLILSACGGNTSQSGSVANKKNQSTAAGSSNPITFKVGSQDTAESAAAQLLNSFKANVEEKTNGEITVDIYYSSTLGSLNDMIEGVSMGTIDMVTAGISSFQGYCDNMVVFDSYLLDGPDDFIAVWNSEVGQAVVQELRDDAGIYVIGYNLSGVGHLDFWAKKDYSSLAELKNANLRTNGAKTVGIACEAFGAVAVHVPSSEQYNAMQTGLIDAMCLDASNMLDQGYLEEGMYRLQLPDNFLGSSLAISQATWEKLTEEQQAIVKECADSYSADSAVMYEEKIADANAKLQEFKIVNCSISAEDIDTANKLVESALYEYYSEICNKDYLDQVIAILEQRSTK